MWLCNAFLFVVTLCHLVCGDIGEDMTEAIQLCCNEGTGDARNTIQECSAEHPLPEGVPDGFSSLCVIARMKCCEEYFQKQQDCDTGIDIALSTKRCSSTHNSTKVCCDECVRGTGMGLAKGPAICGTLTRGNSAEELLADDAYAQCCKKGAQDSSRNGLHAKSGADSFAKKLATMASLCEDYAPTELCAHHCIPVPGSFKCECNPGYMLMADGKNCMQVAKNRCKPRNPCQHKCNDNGVEVKCSCRRGYELMPDGKSCKDIDECQLNLEICLPGTECYNTRGSYKCIPIKEKAVGKGLCPPGFSRNVFNNACDDIDECRLPHPPCPSYVCENTVGAYKCGGVTGDPVNLSSTPPTVEDRCPPGFRYGRNEECEDVDECVAQKDDCNPLSQFCINTHGSFHCQDKVSKHCPPGFKINFATGKCEDINECEEEDICRHDQTCINQLGRYDCKLKSKITHSDCPDGMRMQAGRCEDIDECSQGTHLCDQHQSCLNTNGSYECHCKLGYELDTTTGACIDVNECATGQHDCIPGSQRCDNTVGSFLCIRMTSCGTGYILHHSTGKCEDIDECALGTHNCARAGTEYQCFNIPGSFRCVRRKPSTTSTTTTPRPIDDDYEYYYEEVPDNSTEETNQTDIVVPQPPPSTTSSTTPPTTPSATPPTTPTSPPTQPSPVTRPDDSYNNVIPPSRDDEPVYYNKPIEQSTTPILTEPPKTNPTTPEQPEFDPSEPTEPGIIYSEPIEPTVEPSTTPREMIDNNINSNYFPNEPQTTIIYNEPKPGDPYGSTNYVPYVPETSERAQPTPEPTEPHPIEPKPTSLEPEISNSIFPETTVETDKETASNPYGIYVDVGRRPDPTPYKPTTVVKPMECPQGFERDDYGACFDVDECVSNQNGCHNETEVCFNTMGSYVCNCIEGYLRDFTGNCHPITTSSTTTTTTTTTTTPPPTTEKSKSFFWGYPDYRPITLRPFRPRNPCDVGFYLDQKTGNCEDINECTNGQADCAAVEICVNTMGGYRCECLPNWRLDDVRHRCVPIRANGNFPPGYANEPVPLPGTTKSVTPKYTNFSDFDNSAIPNEKRIPTLKCPIGYRLGDENTCEDINECVSGSARCGSLQICTNLPGGYTCSCPGGMRLVGDHECQDVDECALAGRTPICSHNADCINTVGSYQCKCHKGFRPAPVNDKVCMDVDECTESRTGSLCQQRCNNVWGGYRCSCYRGYRLNSDNSTCTDVDECVELKSKIPCIGRCINEPGSYKCSCPKGYRLSEDKRSCIDIDECETEEATCAKSGVFGSTSHLCINTRGSYKCHRITCPNGYKLENKHRCSKTEKVCRPGDWECAHQPTTISYNFITFVSKLYIPAAKVKLFTMRGPAWPQAKMKFELRLLDVNAPPSVRDKADINAFLLSQSNNEAVMSLVRPLEGPQTVELELSMELYSREQFGGSAVAKIFIHVSEFEF